MVNYMICDQLHDQLHDLWQQLELASEIESDLRDTVGAGSGLLISMMEKLN